MSEDVYQQLCETMSKRGGMYPAMDIPEFYELARELFTPEEAAVIHAMPKGFSPASKIAEEMGKSEDEIRVILETMANKGLCTSADMKGSNFYALPPFVPGIFEFQFMRGTKTDRDRRLAKLIHDFKAAVDSTRGHEKITFPAERVITVDRMINAENKVHTYDQVSTYIEKYDPISVSTCFCRHEGKLIDEKDHCGKPDGVCMQFGQGAQFTIERGMGRQVTKEEAMEVLRQAEDAGLVHCSINSQEINFICNCCSCHCMILKKALRQPKPGHVLTSGFQSQFDPERCTACETCINNCPTKALTLSENEVPKLDLDRCIGCGVCAAGCPSEAIGMIERTGAMVPPVDQKALREAQKASRA